MANASRRSCLRPRRVCRHQSHSQLRLSGTSRGWIVDHHALPAYDPFTLAAARVPWINGEWLGRALFRRIRLWPARRLRSSIRCSLRPSLRLGFGFGVKATAYLFHRVRCVFGAYDEGSSRCAAALLIVCALALLQSKLTRRGSRSRTPSSRWSGSTRIRRRCSPRCWRPRRC
jgi:hypothetical protein